MTILVIEAPIGFEDAVYDLSPSAQKPCVGEFVYVSISKDNRVNYDMQYRTELIVTKISHDYFEDKIYVTVEEVPEYTGE